MSYYSSSECDEGWQEPYEYGEECNYYNTNRIPFCATMGQPLLYYTKVTHGNQKGNKKKENSSNCFVRAFRWYTQDHVPRHKGLSDLKASEFAKWLDAKYEEFEAETQHEPHVHQPKIDPHSATGSDTDKTYDCPESCELKRKSKSYKKRRESDNNKQEFYDIAQRNKSMEYILTPKEMTGTSDTLKLSPVSDYSESLLPNRAIDLPGPVEVITTPIGAQIDTSVQLKVENTQNFQTGKGIAVSTSHEKDKACQCDDGMMKVDVQSQYEPCHCPLANPEKVSIKGYLYGDLKVVAGSGWMRRAEDRVWWRALGEACIQQLMNIS